MELLKKLLLTILLCMESFLIHAQQDTAHGSQKMRFHQMYAAYSMPLGKFTGKSGGGAQAGFSMGLQQFSNVGAKNIFLSYAFSYTSHPYEFESINPAIYTSSTGNYNFINALLGFGTRQEIENATFYFNILGGLNYLDIAGDLGSLGYDDALSFRFSPGAGIIFGQNYNIGIKYFFTNPAIRYSGKYPSSYILPYLPQQFETKNALRQISMVQLFAGVEF